MVQTLSGLESGDSQGDDAVGTGSGDGGCGGYRGSKGPTAGTGEGGGGGGVRCRCGCLERLSATSKFAERVRRGLLERVSGLDLGAALHKAAVALVVMLNCW